MGKALHHGGLPPHQVPQAPPFADLPGMPPPRGCAPLGCGQAHPPSQSPRLGRLVPDDLKALPREAFDNLAAVLAQVEAEGKWLAGLSGAIVALLPNKCDPGPEAHQPPPDGLQAVGSDTRGHPEGMVCQRGTCLCLGARYKGEGG